MLKVVKVKPGWFKDTVIFEAKEYEEAIFGSMLGRKRFWVNKGDRFRSWQTKDYWDVGDYIELENLIDANNQTQFGWEWV